ncbi:hypothetical protein SR70_04855 [Klebsiella aerogenes]|uniref:hypothetical protein n=1 Tax=Klebsiella aerogenes TaxID=548 RepID=UPI0005EFCB5E|nr:hypothetical protein [Klebsiella aerogenes]KJP43600.1 hypothetical protein SR70_04855 [Klebsiella aerogenes]
MLMDNHKIKSDAEFNSVCSMIHRDFERVATYIQEQIYQKDILNPSTTAGKRESLVHKNSNLGETVTIIANAANDTAPKINI